MDTNDLNFDEELYGEEIRRLIMKEAEKVSGLPADQLVVYLSKFEPEGLIKGESSMTDFEIAMNQHMNTSASENGKSASG